MSLPVREAARSERLAALRAEVQRIESAVEGRPAAYLPLGIAQVDDRIAGGGLAASALHEVAAASAELPDDAAATLFLAAVAALQSRAEGDGTVLWAVPRRDLFAPGLAGAGLTPDRLLYAECRSDDEVLAVMEEGLRHGGLAAVIGEVRACAMAPARRLQLAAEEGGTMALMLRRWKRAGREPLADPSPAVTRWRIGCAPSARALLAGSGPVAGLGRTRWHVELARQRGGEPHHWILEAPDAEARLALPAAPAHRPDQAAPGRRAA